MTTELNNLPEKADYKEIKSLMNKVCWKKTTGMDNESFEKKYTWQRRQKVRLKKFTKLIEQTSWSSFFRVGFHLLSKTPWYYQIRLCKEMGLFLKSKMVWKVPTPLYPKQAVILMEGRVNLALRLLETRLDFTGGYSGTHKTVE